MKTPKQTKEETLIENTKLKIEINEWVNGSEAHRKEFAKAFGWNRNTNNYLGNTNDRSCPTWPEIFVEIGKLLSLRDFRDFEGNVSEIDCRLENLVKQIKSEVHPNLNA